MRHVAQELPHDVVGRFAVGVCLKIADDAMPQN
jgi:hypothetical protein